MKNKNKYRIFRIALIISLTSLTIFFFNKVYLGAFGSIDISSEIPVHKLDAKTVIDLIQEGDENVMKAEQVVQIEGVINEINYLNNRVTILLGSGKKDSAQVICDMQKNQTAKISKLKLKDTIKLKGIYKGSLADAIFLNCVISQENYE